MSTSAASTKSLASPQPEAQHAASETVAQQQPPANGDDQSIEGQSAPGGESYPPQKHAGAIGLGPEYGKMREAVSIIVVRIHWASVADSGHRPLETK